MSTCHSYAALHSLTLCFGLWLLACSKPTSGFPVCLVTNPGFADCDPTANTSTYKGYDVDLVRWAAEEIGWKEMPGPPGPNDTHPLDSFYFVCGTRRVAATVDILISNNTFNVCGIGAGAFTISKARIDIGARFSYPYFRTGLGIMASGSQQVTYSPWAFLKPFHYSIWVAMLLTVLFVPGLVWLVENLVRNGSVPCGLNSLHEWRHASYTTILSVFNLDVLAVLSLPAQIIIITFLFLNLVMVSTYTANLAAALTNQAAQSGINSVSDLRARNVAAHALYVERLRKNDFISASPLTWNGSQTFLEVSDKLNKGQLDAYIFDKPILEWWMGYYDKDCSLKFVGDYIEPFDYGISFHKDMPQRMVDDFNKQVLVAQSSKVLSNLQGQYLDYADACLTVNNNNLGSLHFAQVSGLWILLGCALGVGMLSSCYSICRHHIQCDNGQLRAKSVGHSVAGSGPSQDGPWKDPEAGDAYPVAYPSYPSAHHLALSFRDRSSPPDPDLELTDRSIPTLSPLARQPSPPQDLILTQPNGDLPSPVDTSWPPTLRHLGSLGPSAGATAAAAATAVVAGAGLSPHAWMQRSSSSRMFATSSLNDDPPRGAVRPRVTDSGVGEGVRWVPALPGLTRTASLSRAMSHSRLSITSDRWHSHSQVQVEMAEERTSGAARAAPASRLSGLSSPPMPDESADPSGPVRLSPPSPSPQAAAAAPAPKEGEGEVVRKTRLSSKLRSASQKLKMASVFARELASRVFIAEDAAPVSAPVPGEWEPPPHNGRVRRGSGCSAYAEDSMGPPMPPTQAAAKVPGEQHISRASSFMQHVPSYEHALEHAASMPVAAATSSAHTFFLASERGSMGHSSNRGYFRPSDNNSGRLLVPDRRTPTTLSGIPSMGRSSFSGMEGMPSFTMRGQEVDMAGAAPHSPRLRASGSHKRISLGAAGTPLGSTGLASPDAPVPPQTLGFKL